MTLQKLQFENLFLSQKKVSQFAVIFSVVAHIIIVAVIKNMTFINDIIPIPRIENYVDLGYQEFEDTPQVVEHINLPSKDNSEIIPDKTDAALAPQEMQDQSSEVTGLQKDTQLETIKHSPTQTNVTQVPYYKVKPKYPKDALVSGIEGHVLLQLDIKEDGSVENIQVTGGEKLNTFESEARRAVTKWKYKPFLDESGHPIKKEKYLVRVDFKLSDETINN